MADDSSKGLQKKKVQLTFDDFRNVKVVGHQKLTIKPIDAEDINDNNGEDNDNDDVKVVGEHSVVPSSDDIRKKMGLGLKNSAGSRGKVRTSSSSSSGSSIPDTDNKVKKPTSNGSATPLNSGRKRLDQISVDESGWSSNVPVTSELYNLDGYHKLESEKSELFTLLRSKPLPYAGKIMKIMALIDKFSAVFESELTSLSFQDIEEGLELKEIELDDDHDNDGDNKLGLLQDKMDLILFTLMKLLTSQSNNIKTFNPPTMKQLKNNNRPYAKMFSKVRTMSSSMDWGYPKEWRGLSMEENPINTLTLSSKGLTILKPEDRVILLSCLVDWSFSYAPGISSEVFRLSHIKEETGFGVPTYSAPRFTERSLAEIEKDYFTLCKIEREKYEVRWKRRHSYTSGNYNRKFEVFKDIRAAHLALYHTREKSESHEEIDVRFYKKWQELFENEVIDDPLTNPYLEEKYKLRALEGLLVRTNKIGELYLPRLCTYRTEFMKELKTFKSVEEVINFYKYKEERLLNSSTEILKEQSSRFKLIYFDKLQLLDDMLNNRDTSESVYYYELADSSTTLLDLANKLISIGEENDLERDTQYIADTLKYWSVLQTSLSEARNRKEEPIFEEDSGRRLRTRKALRSTYKYRGEDIEDDDSASEYEEEEEDTPLNSQHYLEEFEDDSIIEDQTESRADRLKRRKQRNN